MTGAQHYTEAERLVVEGLNYKDQAVLDAAQVHATLALAAAQAAGDGPGSLEGYGR